MNITSTSNKLPPQVFVIELDEIQRTNLCNAIERSWFSAIRAGNAETAMRLMAISHPNVIIISSHLSDISAYKLAAQLREYAQKNLKINIPFIFILGKDEDQTPYKELDNGLIEILLRPFTPNEIVASIKSLLVRSSPIFQDKILRYKDLTMDLATYRVYRDNKRIHLGPTEFKILQLLVQSPKSIFSRQHIIDYVWGTENSIEPRTVDVHVNRLRTLIRKDKTEPPLIKTVRAAGYCLNLPGEVD